MSEPGKPVPNPHCDKHQQCNCPPAPSAWALEQAGEFRNRTAKAFSMQDARVLAIVLEAAVERGRQLERGDLSRELRHLVSEREYETVDDLINHIEDRRGPVLKEE